MMEKGYNSKRHTTQFKKKGLEIEINQGKEEKIFITPDSNYSVSSSISDPGYRCVQQRNKST